MTRRILYAAAAALTLSGCSDPTEGGGSDAAAVVRSVIEAVENAPRVAAERGGWPSTSFGSGTAEVASFDVVPGGYGYRLEIEAETADACFGALTAAYRGAKAVELNGAAHDPEKLVPRGTPRDRVYPAGVLCGSARMPARIVVARETDGRGPVREVGGGLFTWRDLR